MYYLIPTGHTEFKKLTERSANFAALVKAAEARIAELKAELGDGAASSAAASSKPSVVVVNGNKNVVVSVSGSREWVREGNARIYYDLNQSNKRSIFRSFYQVVSGNTRDEVIEVAGKKYAYELGLDVNSNTKREAAREAARALANSLAGATLDAVDVPLTTFEEPVVIEARNLLDAIAKGETMDSASAIATLQAALDAVTMSDHSAGADAARENYPEIYEQMYMNVPTGSVAPADELDSIDEVVPVCWDDLNGQWVQA